MKKISIELRTEHIADLLRGKRLCRVEGNVSIEIYPDNFGFFITPERLNRLRSLLNPLYGPSAFEIIDTLLKEATKPI